MQQILRDFVPARTASNRYRNYCARIAFFEEGYQRLQEQGFEASCNVGNIGFHFESAEQVDGLIVKVGGAIQVRGCAGDLKSEPLCRQDTGAYLHLSVEG
jgi:hypothetical protein